MEVLATAGSIRKVLVHEVSRVGRRSVVVHGFVERLLEARVSLYWHSQRVETMQDGGKRNPAAGMMLAVLPQDSPTPICASNLNRGSRGLASGLLACCKGRSGEQSRSAVLPIPRHLQFHETAGGRPAHYVAEIGVIFSMTWVEPSKLRRRGNSNV